MGGEGRITDGFARTRVVTRRTAVALARRARGVKARSPSGARRALTEVGRVGARGPLVVGAGVGWAVGCGARPVVAGCRATARTSASGWPGAGAAGAGAWATGAGGGVGATGAGVGATGAGGRRDRGRRSGDRRCDRGGGRWSASGPFSGAGARFILGACAGLGGLTLPGLRGRRPWRAGGRRSVSGGQAAWVGRGRTGPRRGGARIVGRALFSGGRPGQIATTTRRAWVRTRLVSTTTVFDRP